MNVIYDFVLLIYYLLIRATALFSKKARLWVDGRRNWKEQLSHSRKEHERWIWFHCSSLGEFEDCCEIFKQIKIENPSKKTLLTMFSPSGYEIMKKSQEFNLIMYLPFDSKRNSRIFLDILKPDVVFFSRSELWLHYINEVHAKNIRIFLLSLRLNENSNFLKWPARLLFKKCFKAFDYIYCMNKHTQEILLNEFQIKQTFVSGNPRLDRIYKESKSLKEIPQIQKFIKDHFVIVAGSCMLKDESFILKAIEKLKPYKIKWVIVPHEIDSKRIDKLVYNNRNFLRFSNIEALTEAHNVLYFDLVGVLKHLYKYANLAIIGGGFNSIGIHNIIEPSVYGVKTIFGPNYRNYEEAVDLINLRGSEIYFNADELIGIIKHEYDSLADEMIKKKMINYVKANIGAGNKIIESVRALYPGII